MKIALVAIGRRENRYAREFVSHYRSLGFDHVYIADNNFPGEERFEDVLGDFIGCGFVSVHDYRGRVAVQMQAYTDLYRDFGSAYDWVAFLDFDELLVMERGTVGEWLEGIPEDADTVFVNWMCYGDGGMLHDDGRPSLERFLEPLPYDTVFAGGQPEDNQVKCFVRGGQEAVVFSSSPHFPDTARRCVTAAGVPCRRAYRQPYDFSVCHLKHFSTRTIEEWMTNKWQKGVASWDMDTFARRYERKFFAYNRRTPEKEAFIEAFGRNRQRRIVVCLVHYNTPELTRCAVRSLQVHSPGVEVIVFDNSDRRPFRPMDGVEVIDNTGGQVIDFGAWLEGFPEKSPSNNGYASAKHCYSVEWLLRKRRRPFILMDSDVLIRRDIVPLWDRRQAFVGEIRPHRSAYGITVDRVLPFLCFVNVPMLKDHGASYYNPDYMFAVSAGRPNVAYDTGCWFLKDVLDCRLPYREIRLEDYAVHFGHGSWKDKDAEGWLAAHRDLWT